MLTLVGNVVVVLVALVFVAYAVRGNWYRMRWEKPLRQEMRARSATFRAQVELRDLHGPVSFSLHGDAFEVAQRFPPVIGFINGIDYCYRAPETTLEASHGFLHDWIMIQGMPGTGAEPIAIGHRKINRLIWDALVDAGAHPIGPPPER
jgi:hypothetical protein